MLSPNSIANCKVLSEPSVGRRRVSVFYQLTFSAGWHDVLHRLQVRSVSYAEATHSRHKHCNLIESSDASNVGGLNMKVVVIGAGPVGSLAALYAAKRGHDVEVYELRGGT